MIDKPAKSSLPPSGAIGRTVLKASLPALAFLSAALILAIMMLSILFPEAVSADASPASESSTVVIEQSQGVLAGEVVAQSGLPYNRETAGTFADQRRALAETASTVPARAGSAIGAAALVVAALGWSALLLQRAAGGQTAG